MQQLPNRKQDFPSECGFCLQSGVVACHVQYIVQTVEKKNCTCFAQPTKHKVITVLHAALHHKNTNDLRTFLPQAHLVGPPPSLLAYTPIAQVHFARYSRFLC